MAVAIWWAASDTSPDPEADMLSEPSPSSPLPELLWLSGGEWLCLLLPPPPPKYCGAEWGWELR